MIARFRNHFSGGITRISSLCLKGTRDQDAIFGWMTMMDKTLHVESTSSTNAKNVMILNHLKEGKSDSDDAGSATETASSDHATLFR